MSGQVLIRDWLPGACSRTAIAAICAHSTLDAAAAQAVLDLCRAGKRAVVESPDLDRARRLVNALEAVAFQAEIVE